MRNEEARVRDAFRAFLHSASSIGHNKRDTDFERTEDLARIFECQQASADGIMAALAAVDPALPSHGLRILDIGCSMGALCFGLRKYASHVVGVEIEPEAVACAEAYVQYKRYGEMDFFVDDGVTLAATASRYPQYFDLVIVKEVVEHVSSEENVGHMLENIKRVLRPGGRLFMESPNYQFPFEPHLSIPIPPNPSKRTVRRIAGWFGKLGSDHDRIFFEHLNFTGPRHMERLFRAHDFSFVNVYERYKLPRIMGGSHPLTARYALAGFVLKALRATGLARAASSLIARLDLYPTLWYLLKENNV